MPAALLVVASKNPVKGRAALEGFERVFPERSFRLESISVDSGVSHQPMSDAETLKGARQRAEAAERRRPEADYWIGIEGGVEDGPDGMCAFAWVVVRSREHRGQGRSGTFFLPEEVARRVRAGMELGEADDQVFGRDNSKQEEGAVGLLTGGVIDRTALYEHAVVLALVGFKSPELYRGS